MLLNKEQLSELLDESGSYIKNGKERSDEVKDLLRDSYEVDKFKVGDYEFERLVVHGGGEGDGEDYHVIFSVSKDGQTSYYEVPGYYASDEGGTLEWDSTYEVEPRQVTVTQYFQKGEK